MGLYNPSNVTVVPLKSRLTNFQQLDDGSSVESLLLSLDNVARHQAVIFNDGDSPVFLALNNVATKNFFTVKILPDGAYITPDGYTGEIRAAAENSYNILFSEFSYY